MPPSDQFSVHSRDIETSVSTKRLTARRRIAFLLMEYESVTFREYGVDTFVMQIHVILSCTSVSRNQESRPSWRTMNTTVYFLTTVFSMD